MDKYNRYKFFDGEVWDGELRVHLHSLWNDAKDRREALCGTSSVGEIVSKPLTYWAVGIALCKLGWINHSDPELSGALFELRLDRRAAAADKLKKLLPQRVALMEQRGIWKQIQTMTAGEFAQACDEAYFAHTKTLDETAEDGTNLHAECEKYVKACITANEVLSLEASAILFHDRITPFVRWSQEHVSKFLWSEMHAYSRKLWTGCISDAGYMQKDGKVGIIEFKRAKAAYDTHFWQVGGQHLAIEENGGFDRDGNKVFELPAPVDEHMVFAFGHAEPETIKPHVGDEAIVDCRAFKAELYLYKVRNAMPLDGFNAPK